MKRCPHCKEDIEEDLENLGVCPECDELLDDGPEDEDEPEDEDLDEEEELNEGDDDDEEDS